MMGRCKLTSICGSDRCYIECPENEVCKEQCARMDRYEYCVECPEYEEDCKGKKILDATCGSKTIWFDKENPSVIYCDKRRESFSGIWKASERLCSIDPDIQCDFTNLPFGDDSFSLVVFDPPHLKKVGETAWLAKKYGKLGENWRKMLHDGFTECMRVLKEDGVLIFKWSEYDIPASEVWDAIGQKPLFGHRSGKKSKTFWGCYMKGVE